MYRPIETLVKKKAKKNVKVKVKEKEKAKDESDGDPERKDQKGRNPEHGDTLQTCQDAK